MYLRDIYLKDTPKPVKQIADRGLTLQPPGGTRIGGLLTQPLLSFTLNDWVADFTLKIEAHSDRGGNKSSRAAVPDSVASDTREVVQDPLVEKKFRPAQLPLTSNDQQVIMLLTRRSFTARL